MIFKQNCSIYKVKRQTYYEELIKKAKFGPAVGQYDPKIKDKVLGNFKSSMEKYSSVIGDAVYHSMHVPSFYKPIN